MTEDGWLDQLLDLQFTLPQSEEHRELERQMWRRIQEIKRFLWKGGPEPDPEWKPTVPDLSAEEKEALFNRAMERWDMEWEYVGRALDEMRAAGELPGKGAADGGGD